MLFNIIPLKQNRVVFGLFVVFRLRSIRIHLYFFVKWQFWHLSKNISSEFMENIIWHHLWYNCCGIYTSIRMTAVSLSHFHSYHYVFERVMTLSSLLFMLLKQRMFITITCFYNTTGFHLKNVKRIFVGVTRYNY